VQLRPQQQASLSTSQAAPGALQTASFQHAPTMQWLPSQHGVLALHGSTVSTGRHWFVAMHIPSKQEPPQQSASAAHSAPTSPHC
jgi:hypothetical protein